MPSEEPSAEIPLQAALDVVEQVEKEKLSETLVSKTPKQAVKESTRELRDRLEEAAHAQ